MYEMSKHRGRAKGPTTSRTSGAGTVQDFRLLLETGDMVHLSPRLYQLLSSSAGFIAHYDIQGFRDVYAGRLGALLDGESCSLVTGRPAITPFAARIGALVPAPIWERPHLAEATYKDGLPVGEVLRQVCEVASELQEAVRSREASARREERIGLMRRIAQEEGFDVALVAAA
jgi:hypothetical protein